MKDKLIRRMAELKRRWKMIARTGDVPARTLASWHGRPVYDRDKRIGHVTHVRLDGTGGAWIEVDVDWGVLDWLIGMGAGHPRFTFHSEDLEPSGDRHLVLKSGILKRSEAA